MQRRSPMLPIAVILLAASAVLYLIQYLIFRTPRDISFYFAQDLAFVPIEVLLVVVIIERMLEGREKRALLHKLNMVIGAFFSEVGTRVLGDVTPAVVGKEEVLEQLALKADWRRADFRRAIEFARRFSYQIDLAGLDLNSLRDLLVAKREFMLRLLENPNLLEHQRFTDLLWAVFHLAEELSARESLARLSEHDAAHLAEDTRRAYSQLAAQWVAYAQHLQASYPFLYSLVVRTHPLQPHPAAAIP